MRPANRVAGHPREHRSWCLGQASIVAWYARGGPERRSPVDSHGAPNGAPGYRREEYKVNYLPASMPILCLIIVQHLQSQSSNVRVLAHHTQSNNKSNTNHSDNTDKTNNKTSALAYRQGEDQGNRTHPSL